MSYFPVTNSNLSATHLAQFIQEKYSLSTNTTCKIIKAGINDTYLIHDNNDKFIFRIYSFNWRTEKEITEELQLLNELKQNNISVSYPIMDKENKYVQILNAPEGDRFAVLFSYAEGQKLHTYSTDIHYEIGKIMAQFHQVTHKKNVERVTYTPEILLTDSLKKIANFLPVDTEEMKFMQSTQIQFLHELYKVDLSKIRQGIVHLDIWFDNLNITEQNAITIFDFDFCGNGWLCMDFAYYILQVNSIERDETICETKVAAFLNGYESITPISEEEKRLIPLLGVSLYFFYLGVQCQRYDNWSNTFLNESYLKRFINALVKRYYDINKLDLLKSA